MMFAGHVGAALAIGSAERRINVGIFVFAAVLLDFVLWLLVLFGGESVLITAEFARTHQPEFVFPYSHGLLASLLWSAVAALAILLWYPGLTRAKMRAGALVGAAVFSHWLLDALVHAPELPVAGTESMKMGLGLWQTMPLALAVEAAIALAGLWIFVAGASISRARQVGLWLFSLLILAFTIVGMTVAPPPPSVTAMAATSLVTIVLVCVLAAWLGGPSALKPRD
jgi:hypothetical protein